MRDPLFARDARRPRARRPRSPSVHTTRPDRNARARRPPAWSTPRAREPLPILSWSRRASRCGRTRTARRTLPARRKRRRPARSFCIGNRHGNAPNNRLRHRKWRNRMTRGPRSSRRTSRRRTVNFFYRTVSSLMYYFVLLFFRILWVSAKKPRAFVFGGSAFVRSRGFRVGRRPVFSRNRPSARVFVYGVGAFRSPTSLGIEK